MDFADTLEQLNILIGDTDDFTFTTEEKTRALTKAWNDPYVVSTVWDNSLTYSTTSYQYARPATMTTVKGIYISASNSTSSFPEPVSDDLWSVVGSNIQFAPGAGGGIPNGYTIYIKGAYKLDPDVDTLDTVALQEYVLANAAFETLSMLTLKKANRFLKNDTTMGEAIALKREFRQDMLQARGRLQREFE